MHSANSGPTEEINIVLLNMPKSTRDGVGSGLYIEKYARREELFSRRRPFGQIGHSRIQRTRKPPERRALSILEERKIKSEDSGQRGGALFYNPAY